MSVVAIPVQLQSFSLSGSGSSIGDTVLNLKSFKDIGSTNLTMASFGSVGYGTIEPGNGTQEEQISFSGITQNADGTAQLTGVKHVLFISPFTESSGMTTTHPGSVVFVISNTSGYENAIYSYINGAIASGGVPATQATPGITALTINPASIGTPIAVGANNTVSGTAISTSNPVVDQASIPPGVIWEWAGVSTPTGWLPCDSASLARAGTYANLYAAIGTTYGAVDGSHFNVPDKRGRVSIGAGTGTKVLTFSSRSSNTVTVTGSTNTTTSDIQTGQAFTYHTSGTVMTGLANDTVYYLVRTAYNQLQLSSTLANAQNAVVISLSSDGSGTQTFTSTLSVRTLGDTGGEETHAMSSGELLAHTHTTTITAGSANINSTGSSYGASGSTGSAGSNTAMNNMQSFLVTNFIIKY